MHYPDIRWQQRLASFQKALQQLQAAVELSHQRTLTQLEKQGVIQVFEFTHELAWNMLKISYRIKAIPILKAPKMRRAKLLKLNLLPQVSNGWR